MPLFFGIISTCFINVTKFLPIPVYRRNPRGTAQYICSSPGKKTCSKYDINNYFTRSRQQNNCELQDWLNESIFVIPIKHTFSCLRTGGTGSDVLIWPHSGDQETFTESFTVSFWSIACFGQSSSFLSMETSTELWPLQVTEWTL